MAAACTAADSRGFIIVSLRSGPEFALDAVDHEVDDNRDHGGEEDQHEGRGSYRQEECHATEEVIQDLWGLREDGAHRAREDGERQDEVEGCQRAVLHLGRGGTARERTTTWR